MKPLCYKCQSHCCGKSSVKAPVLMPSETKDYVAKEETEKNFYRLMRNTRTGCCVFLWTQSGQCAIYDRRPIECKLYPWILSFKDGKVCLVLNKECPKNAEFPRPELPNITGMTKEWMEGFEKLPT